MMLINCLQSESYLGHVLSGRLDPHSRAVSTGVSVHAADHRGDGRLLPVASWRMRHVGAEEDDGLLEHGRPVPRARKGANYESTKLKPAQIFTLNRSCRLEYILYEYYAD